ncbi:hypothetical protein SODALDRAFT_113265 [Sodiomyces alkalinus F11]|uniref:Protein kinase domain-containing protein n=1 Tax=Sodiomyces alkalinus (strain CBS 110278 / VKM F-3762 / F11) TaxID=1314773 RepID=A0A3N2Q3G3_SODAK|nr:hypothetical protein SODALDRAFT_113265 [Sodiomyces alkalinus F11]ROT41165.1 hypothetical protein SODALDRAFT_113265 [Sodiomyces alkalinus F11]
MIKDKSRRTWSSFSFHPRRRAPGSWRLKPPSRLASRLLALVGFVALFHLVDLHLHFREALRAKYLPTRFTLLSAEDEALLSRPGWVHQDGPSQPTENIDREVLLANRQEWRRLGGGREGEAFVYDGSVIKIYNDGTSPFRNCFPGDATSLPWPAEIPATLLLGGFQGYQEGTDEDEDEASMFRSGFMPVRDYFLASVPASHGGPTSPKWHLVTPFLSSGTLETLASRIRREGEANSQSPSSPSPPPSYREVDRRYRPAFEGLLAALERMHEQRQLCHDDIKPENIFVASDPMQHGERPARWVLADLGNARHPDHAYHRSSALWTADTNQLRDCRANDVVRLVKSYAAFVRAACADRAAFDAAFAEGVGPLSRMYWAVVAKMMDRENGRFEKADGGGVFAARAAAHLSRFYSGSTETDSDYREYGDEEDAARLGTGVEEEGSGRWSQHERGKGSQGLLGQMLRSLTGFEEGALRVEVSRALRVGASERMGTVFGLSPLLGVPVSGCRVVKEEQ